MTTRFCQYPSPVNSHYVLVDKWKAKVIDRSNKPFPRIPIVGKVKRIKPTMEILKVLYPELILDEGLIANSLNQQVMSKFRPYRFPVFKDNKLWSQFTPQTQLEKIIYQNLKRQKAEVIDFKNGARMVADKKKSTLFSGAESIPFKRG